MGYHIRTGLVREHESVLDTVLMSIERGVTLRYDCTNPEVMNTLKYQFNRILRATTILTKECQGRFVGLRERTKVLQDWKNMTLLVAPAIQAPGITTIEPVKPNEFDAVERLKQFEGKMDLIRFSPSAEWDIASFRLAIQEIGFDLMPNPDEPGWIGGEMSNGDMEYAIARTEDKALSGFDMLGAYKLESDKG